MQRSRQGSQALCDVVKVEDLHAVRQILGVITPDPGRPVSERRDAFPGGPAALYSLTDFSD
jgi:hypothetical protein